MTPFKNSNSSSMNVVLSQRKHRPSSLFIGSKCNNKCQGSFAGFSAFGVTAQTSNTKWLLTFVVLGLLLVAASAVSEKTVQSSSATPLSTLSSSIVGSRDEIYIDDEGSEGSGGRGELHDDLEKDPDYSGSGFGPDDEDSTTDNHHRRTNIHSQSGNSKSNTNDNDIINSRTHQTNSGSAIIGSGTSGNSDILHSGISASGSNTGLNTIGKEHSSTIPSSSSASLLPSTTTSKTTATINDHKQQAIINITSSLYPVQTLNNPSLPANIPIHADSKNNNDDDDFDLDETIGGGGGIAGSGDGAIIGHDNDDDNTGDDDIDNTDIIERVHHTHNLGNAATTVDKYDSVTDVGVDHASKEDRKHILDSKVDDFDEDDIQGNYDEEDDNSSNAGNGNETDDEGTEMYTDVTDPIGSSGGNSDTTHEQRGNNNQGTIQELDTNNINSLPPETKVEHTTGNEVLIMNTSDDDRTTSFFAQPGILAAVIGGAVVGLLCAILVVMFIVYRMRKKDEGSYALDEPKRSPAVNSYAKNANNREFYA